MNWQNILSDLYERGWTQAEIAFAVGCGQASISGMSLGRTTNPNFRLGQSLHSLWLSGQHFRPRYVAQKVRPRPRKRLEAAAPVPTTTEIEAT